MSESTMTRRDFLRTTAAAAVVGTAAIPLLTGQKKGKQAKVILIRHQNVVDTDWRVDASIISQMLDEAMVNLFGVKNAEEAWKKVVKPADIVGIKTNVWRYLRTPVELEAHMKRRIMERGVKESDISIDDRGVLSNSVFARATTLINVRPMRAHNWSGVGGCLKNYIMFTPSPPDYHPDSCVDLGAIWKFPAVEGKTRLNILLMLTPQFHCMGPHHFDKEYTWLYKGMLVSTDPVSVDAVGLKIIEAQRSIYFKEPTPMRPPVRHIVAAEEKHGVGVANLRNIELVKLGWKEGALI
ncbi:MAG TPA: hypothetical protein DEP53_02705 [Bacteroidetes bacterium]|nr:hypothetical protein [Bacteroidota bacterium]